MPPFFFSNLRTMYFSMERKLIHSTPIINNVIMIFKKSFPSKHFFFIHLTSLRLKFPNILDFYTINISSIRYIYPFTLLSFVFKFLLINNKIFVNIIIFYNLFYNFTVFQKLLRKYYLIECN